jgi:hypothetical protein
MDNGNKLSYAITTVCSSFALILLFSSFFITANKQKITIMIVSSVLLIISYLSILYISDCLTQGLSALFSGSCGYSLSYLGVLAYGIYLLVTGYKKRNIPHYYYELFITLFVLLFSSIFMCLTFDPTSFNTGAQYAIGALSWFIIIMINTIINFYITDG